MRVISCVVFVLTLLLFGGVAGCNPVYGNLTIEQSGYAQLIQCDNLTVRCIPFVIASCGTFIGKFDGIGIAVQNLTYVENSNGKYAFYTNSRDGVITHKIRLNKAVMRFGYRISSWSDGNYSHVNRIFNVTKNGSFVVTGDGTNVEFTRPDLIDRNNEVHCLAWEYSGESGMMYVDNITDFNELSYPVHVEFNSIESSARAPI